MGTYLNPGSAAFEEAARSKIYVDKTELINYTNEVLGTSQKYICVSRPRRFGKSMAANMLTAYYSKGCDSSGLFAELKIAGSASYEEYRNRYDVIALNIQNFVSKSKSMEDMIDLVNKRVAREVLREYPEVDYADVEDLTEILQNITDELGCKFVFIIDEWDCIFRENKNDQASQRKYLDFLRNLLKDKTYVALAYMTGILPIKKYGTHSALNMFDEYSMMDPGELARYVGFEESEVRELCQHFDMDFEETRKWYDGYEFWKVPHIYNPKSVVDAMRRGRFDSYWTQTETYEALKIYLDMNFDGIKDIVVRMLSGERCKINAKTFQNDMTTFKSKDDVMTLLVHLGYLAYDFKKQEVFIPNKEVRQEFENAIDGAGWNQVVKAIKSSDELLRATWNGDEDAVAKGIEEVHMDTASILTYNDENDLSCVISLTYYAAKEYYTVIRELPTGKGFADIVYLPRKSHADKPAMVVELKWDKSAEGAIAQIKEKKYGEALEEYRGNMLLIGINYDKENKKHNCVIEKAVK